MEITLDMLSRLGSEDYPYHLTWKELNDPISVLQDFPENWDLATCRMFLKKHQVEPRHFTVIDAEELKHFLEDLEKLMEAVYVLNMQFKAASESLTLDTRGRQKGAGRKKR
ncbi:hypothetical protein [Desertivirga xinjiangensis]|uniref:hypothetical protein n=1 Tax=Desertivirga xinjiangensis TaxID=539206 RepID=UPI00210EF16A|nr:hypothetical protein [Pedobacter xinjiangensis]